MLPDHRHDDALCPWRVLSGKGGRREHLDRWIDVQEVLLRPIWKILDPGHDRIVRFRDVDGIVDHPIVGWIARMTSPLAATHELIVARLAKRIAHSAVITAEADATFHGLAEIVELILLDL